MSIVQKLKSTFGMGGGIAVDTFRCEECGNEIESSKSIERVQCMECLSSDVSRIEE